VLFNQAFKLQALNVDVYRVGETGKKNLRIYELFRNFLLTKNTTELAYLDQHTKIQMKYMLKSYWTLAWRTLVRNKFYTLVNVLGLTLGICACLVIYLIASYEFSFDTFHPDRDRIYCVDIANPHGHMNSVPGFMPAQMRSEMTGFGTVAAFWKYIAKVAIPGGQKGEAKRFDDAGRIAIAEPQYFNIFHYQWLSGNAATSLSMPNSVVLTLEKAKEYFGGLDPDKVIGRSIYYDDSLMVTVTGVVADWAGNSDFNFSQWISYATIPVSFLKDQLPMGHDGRFSTASQVMVKLAAGVNPSRIDAQFIDYSKRHFNGAFGILLRPLSGIHFHSEYGGTDRKAGLPVLYTLMAVAGFILILAIVNFVNLSTAQSMQRAREIGVRKVMGGSRSGIAVQFFTETLLVTVAAVSLAALMVWPVSRLFADLIPGGVHFRLDGSVLSFLILVTAVTTLLAGFYPARVLGNYQPTVTLKGINALSGGGKGALRKGLIVFQFTISLMFIIASIVIGSQLRYVLRADLGFKADAIITLKFIRGDKTGKTAVLADKLRQLNGVTQVIRESMPPMGPQHSMFVGGGLKNSNQQPIEISLKCGNEDFVPFYGLKIVAGRNLLRSDTTREILINQAYAHALGFADVSKAIGREVVVTPDVAYPIAGVVADFYENSFHQATGPVTILHDLKMERTIAVKIAAKGMAAGDVKAIIGNIEKEWKALIPGQPFVYSFLDESIANLYTDDLRTERLTNVAMGITVFISCLGLLGLAIFSTGRRTREIGIRKVLGATVSGIMVLLCKEIVGLVVLALLIATPLAWYFMHGWLQGFAYRTSLSGWMFLVAGAAAIGIALLTVGFQAMKAALADPVKSLRTE
jgi:ABC-type antimicrobial peptide transport system permease subunit